MGKLYEQLDEKLISFIESQHMFFIGTAPVLFVYQQTIYPQASW